MYIVYFQDLLVITYCIHIHIYNFIIFFFYNLEVKMLAFIVFYLWHI